MLTDDKLLIWLYNRVKHLKKNLSNSGGGGSGTPGQKGDRGEKGNDGIGIKDIINSDGKLKIELTNGVVKEVSLPSTKNPIKKSETGEFVLKDVPVISGVGNSRIFRITFKEPFDNSPFIELYHNDNTARLNYVFNITNTSFDLSTNYVYDTRIYRYFAFDTN